MSGLPVKYKSDLFWLALNIRWSLLGWHQKIMRRDVKRG